MLTSTTATATVAVKDIAKAKQFYEGTLGLQRAGVEEMGTLLYQAGASTLLVYPSQFAGTNRATAVTWVVGDRLDQVVQSLKAKGVAFEHYDLPDTKRQGDIHVAGSVRNAWFKDPDGNIHALVAPTGAPR
jgi:catechol 2,3-dioxygenase-like lactoylglutathione lyase family enzyme